MKSHLQTLQVSNKITKKINKYFRTLWIPKSNIENLGLYFDTYLIFDKFLCFYRNFFIRFKN